MQLKQLLPTLLLVTSLTTGLVSAMARPIQVTAQVSDEWDKSSLKFNTECTNICGLVTAQVCNVGSGDMTGDTQWELYYSESGNPKDGSIEATGTISPLPASDPFDATVSCVTLSFTTTKEGNYMFRAMQRTGHPGTPGEVADLWSTACTASCNQSSPTPEPSTEPSPEPSVDPSPSPISSVDPSPTPTPTPTPTATPTPTPTPTATPSSSSSNTDSGNGTGGQVAQASTESKPRSRILGASTLADTGTSDVLLAQLVFALGAVITLGSLTYAQKQV